MKHENGFLISSDIHTYLECLALLRANFVEELLHGLDLLTSVAQLAG